MENLVLALFFIVLWVVLYNLIQGALDKRKQKCSCGTPYRPEDVVGEDVAEAFGTFGTRKLRVKVRCAACGKRRGAAHGFTPSSSRQPRLPMRCRSCINMWRRFRFPRL